MKCPNCGYRHVTGAYCPSCGYRQGRRALRLCVSAFFLLGMAVWADVPKASPAPVTVTERDAAGKIVQTRTIVPSPSGYSVTVRDASGKVVGTYFHPRPGKE